MNTATPHSVPLGLRLSAGMNLSTAASTNAASGAERKVYPGEGEVLGVGPRPACGSAGSATPAGAIAATLLAPTAPRFFRKVRLPCRFAISASTLLIGPVSVTTRHLLSSV